MKNEIKKYLDELSKQNSRNYLLFYKFYYYPSKSLGGSEEETLNEYYKYGDIKYFLLNNEFVEFQNMCIFDEEFVSRLDFILLRKLRYILFDSKYFKENYNSDLEDENLRNWCKNKVPLDKKYIKKYNRLQLVFGIGETFKKIGWMYEMNFEKSRIEDFDISKVENAISWNTHKLDWYLGKYIEPIEQRNLHLKIIKEDNYSKPDECFLRFHNGHDKKSFVSLVCNNEFLEVIELDLLPQELPKIIIENIVEILIIGINLKCLRINAYENFKALYNRLGKDYITKFDYKKAERLIGMLENKKNNKTLL